MAEPKAPTGQPTLCHHDFAFGALVDLLRNTASRRCGMVSVSLAAIEVYEEVIGLRDIWSLLAS
jgi:hypothetical protein